MTSRTDAAGEAFQHVAGDFFEPRQGNISDAELRYYLKRARDLRAQAFHDVARGLLTAIRDLPDRARRAGAELRHSTLWRAPGSGNCLNC